MSPDTVYGLTWPAIFALRDGLAVRVQRQHRQCHPIEEYYSAGNEAIAEVLLRYDPTHGTTFRATLAARLYLRMALVPRYQAGAGNRVGRRGQAPTFRATTYAVPPDWPQWETYLHPRQAAPDVATLSRQLEADLGHWSSPKAAHSYCLAQLGWTCYAIADQVGHHWTTVLRHVREVRELIVHRKPQWTRMGRAPSTRRKPLRGDVR